MEETYSRKADGSHMDDRYIGEADIFDFHYYKTS